MSKQIQLYGKNKNQLSNTGFLHTENLPFHTHVLKGEACSGHPGSSVIDGKLV